MVQKKTQCHQNPEKNIKKKKKTLKRRKNKKKKHRKEQDRFN